MPGRHASGAGRLATFGRDNRQKASTGSLLQDKDLHAAPKARRPHAEQWSIGRTWKPREGWSRPVLMVERQPTSTRPRRRRRTRQGPAKAHRSTVLTRAISQQQHASRPLSGPRTTRRRETVSLLPITQDLRAAMAQRRPVPFRTRKLRPGTAMVLHPTGCGRVARRRTTRQGPPDEANNPRGPFLCVFLLSSYKSSIIN